MPRYSLNNTRGIVYKAPRNWLLDESRFIVSSVWGPHFLIKLLDNLKFRHGSIPQGYAMISKGGIGQCEIVEDNRDIMDQLKSFILRDVPKSWFVLIIHSIKYVIESVTYKIVLDI